MRTFLIFLMLPSFVTTVFASDYVVIVQKDVQQNPEWKAVIDALIDKHDGDVFTYQNGAAEVLPELKKTLPRYSCFVAPREHATREFVAEVHQITRRLDADPYTDTFWGILTGYDAANALEIAKDNTPLVVRKVASGTEVALDMCEQGLWYDELVRNKFVRKQKGGSIEQLKGPDDTTQSLVNALNDFQPDLFVTSGHATERNWQIGFTYRNGFFRSQSGQMYGVDTSQRRIEVESPNPKVYLPIGNCLMGNIDGPDAMALAWMNDVGVRQMIGYTVPTWFGYGGWGVLDYFVEQPGRYSLAEAFFANHHALIHSLESRTGNQRGLEFDRDVVAFYGDPKWNARMAVAKTAYDQTLTIAENVYTFRITPNRGSHSFEPVNINGAQRGWRPIVQFLPERLHNIRVVKGTEFNPVVTDDFVLIPNPRECDEDVTYEIVFTADSTP